MTRTVDSRFRPRGRRHPKIYAFMLECGGSTKTTSATSMAVEAALRGYPGTIFDFDANRSTTTILGYDEEAMKGRKTVLDLIHGTAILDEVALPARYRVGDDYDDDAFAYIPGLRLVPSCKEMSTADTAIAEDADRQDWFAEILLGYDGDDDDVFWLDFPASYGRMVYSVIRMLDEDDAVIPSVRADPKDVKLLVPLFEELDRVREKNRLRRSVPGRPTVNHLILTAPPLPVTPKHRPGRPRRSPSPCTATSSRRTSGTPPTPRSCTTTAALCPSSCRTLSRQSTTGS
ncbi:ParA family protein [Streptomyces sp. NPDC056254]|uniref:ParA family protein n=1 Tax=Streptomyces sp. NPDC056254 TaxID=3345763 RepID=UPI0035DC305C